MESTVNLRRRKEPKGLHEFGYFFIFTLNTEHAFEFESTQFVNKVSP
jgi:hypothetical protein